MSKKRRRVQQRQAGPLRPCPVCGESCQDTFTVCTGCLRRTHGRVWDLPGLEARLEETLARVDVLAERNDGGRSAETPLVYKEAAGDALRDMRQLLVGWCRLLWEERRVPLPADSVLAMSARLAVNVWALGSHPAADQLVSEVHAITRRVVRVVDLPEFRTRIHVGPCPQVDEQGVPCPGQVTAFVPQDIGLRPTMSCGACAKEWPSEQWVRTGERIQRRGPVHLGWYADRAMTTLIVGRKSSPDDDRRIDVPVDDEYVSDRHARIVRRGDGSVWVEDLGSLNGTLVNGTRVYGLRRLSPGDRLRFGRTEVPLPLDLFVVVS